MSPGTLAAGSSCKLNSARTVPSLFKFLREVLEWKKIRGRRKPDPVQVRCWGGGVTPQVQSAARARVALPPSRGARLEPQEKLTLHPADPAGPVAPPYVGDQLEKHDVGCRECRGRICFDLSSSAAH